MTKKDPKRALGRGLGNLLESTPEAKAERANLGIVEIETEKVRASEDNPRKRFDKTAIEELAATIKSHGLLQPVLVQSEGAGYVVISGERRLRACRLLGLERIPCIVKNLNKEEQLAVSLIENIQREQLDAIEEGDVYRRLVEEYSLTQEQVAEKVGKNRATIANRIRLLQLPEPIQTAIADGRLTEGQARPLLSLKNEALQLKLLREILTNSMNSREVEELVRRQKGEKKKPSSIKTGKSDVDITEVARSMESALDTRVKIQHNSATGAGKIVVEYFSIDDFERLRKFIMSHKK